MFGEPQPTNYDVRFNLFGFNVRIHPYFWLLSLFLGRSLPDSRSALIFIAVVFVSIIVHELGHAFVIRHFGFRPRIVLHGFGGLAIYDPNSSRRGHRNGNQQILISLAGPLAGFALAAIVAGVLFATNHYINFSFPFVSAWNVVGNRAGEQLFGEFAMLAFCLLQVNIFWGLLNLLPIYPLDGGQVARELFLSNSSDAIKKSLTLSLITAAAMTVLCFLKWNQPYMAFMFGFMAYSNYRQLSPQSGAGFGGFGGGSRGW